MTETVDVQLFLKEGNDLLINKLKHCLSYDFIIEEKNSEATWAISYRCDNDLIRSVDTEIGDFLSKLLPFEETILKFNNTLRVGIFYDVKETIVCPVLLGEYTISLLARFHAKLSLTGYLCSGP